MRIDDGFRPEPFPFGSSRNRDVNVKDFGQSHSFLAPAEIVMRMDDGFRPEPLTFGSGRKVTG